jgi:hypothetical protein
MGAGADRFDGVLGGADQTHDLRVLQLLMVAQQPQDGIGTVMAARHWRVARAALFGAGGDHGFGRLNFQFQRRIFFGCRDLFAGQLAGLQRVEALDALRSFAIGDGFHLEGMQRAELGDLIEGECGVVDQPDGGRFGHQKCFGHWWNPSKKALQARSEGFRSRGRASQ